MLAQLLNDLVAIGMTEKQIGDEIGRSQATVNRLRKGQHHSLGWQAVDKLRALHRDRLPHLYPAGAEAA